jgi:hypothetical protein
MFENGLEVFGYLSTHFTIEVIGHYANLLSPSKRNLIVFEILDHFA